MRGAFAALIGALALSAAASIATAQQASGGWSYQYAEGAAVATQRDSAGAVTATLSCRPPDGDIILTDHSFGRPQRAATQATLQIGPLAITVPATVTRDRRKYIVSVRLPQRPPILAAVRPDAPFTVSVGGETRTYREGAGQQLSDVAYACWGG